MNFRSDPLRSERNGTSPPQRVDSSNPNVKMEQQMMSGVQQPSNNPGVGVSAASADMFNPMMTPFVRRG